MLERRRRRARERRATVLLAVPVRHRPAFVFAPHFVFIVTGRTADFEAFLRNTLENFRAAGVIFGVYHRQFGPGPMVWQVVENLRSYSELSRGGILRAFGDEETERVLADLAGAIIEVERTVLEYDMSLSYGDDDPN